MLHINISPKKLYEGCLLATLAHAVTAGEYPVFHYEHSWDGINYCLNNSAGCRGVITFHPTYIIAAFRDEAKVVLSKDAFDYFEGAQEEIKELANTETLPYLLDEIEGVTKPLITAALWGTWTELFSNQSLESFLENCANIIENQLLDFSDAMEAWNDNYEFHNGQEMLIGSLFKIKTRIGVSDTIRLTKDEIAKLYGDIDKCFESLGELNIYL